MSYSHNPFLVLSDALISSGLVDVASRVKATETKLKDTLYLIANTNTFDFDETIDLLPLFETHTNGSVSFNNQIYTGSSLKIHLKININYTWTNAEYPPRYSLVVMKNNTETLFSIYEGVNDSVERMNKLFEDVLIDLNNGDQIKITLHKDQIETHDTITILKNSYISFGLV
jgi:hypothetical protein